MLHLLLGLQAVGQPNHQHYRDPARKVGSQAETPVLTLRHGVVSVRGYQSYDIRPGGQLVYIRKPAKFRAIEALLARLHTAHACESLVDVGCNAGLISLIARRAGYRSVLGLDHDPEYVGVFSRVVRATNATGLQASVFSFGNPIPTAADVVFCGAILHWVYCLTANFAQQGFDGILRYLLRYASSYLLIEWVDPSDSAVKGFGHIKKCGKGLEAEFTVANFERAIARQATIESKLELGGESRVLYVLRPGAPSGAETLADRFLIGRANMFSKTRPGCDGTAWVLDETRRNRWAKAACRAESPVTHTGTCDQATQKLVLPRDICPTDRIELTFQGETSVGPIRDEGSVRLALPMGDQPAVTSGAWIDAAEQIVVKQVYSFKTWELVRRESCLLEKLRHFSWAPQLLCFNGDTLVMRHVGKRVQRSTLPPDHKEQMHAILKDMRSLGIRHNDITSPYRVDVMVSPGGQLRLVDFGHGSIKNDFSCNCSGIPSTMPCFKPKLDADVLKALQKMAAGPRAGGHP